MNTDELRKKTCCLSGHRDIPRDKRYSIAEKTADEIRKLVDGNGVCFFGVGGAIGYDTIAAKVLFGLREKEFPNIKVILVYPFDGFTDRWSLNQRLEYDRMLPMYDKVVRISDKPSRQAYLDRDRHLVNSSAYCITYCIYDQGGTAYTVEYALQRGLLIRNIAHMH